MIEIIIYLIIGILMAFILTPKTDIVRGCFIFTTTLIGWPILLIFFCFVKIIEILQEKYNG